MVGVSDCGLCFYSRPALESGSLVDWFYIFRLEIFVYTSVCMRMWQADSLLCSATLAVSLVFKYFMKCSGAEF